MFTFLSPVVSHFSLFTFVDWVGFIALVILLVSYFGLMLTSKSKRSLMDSHHYTSYRKLAGARAKPFNEVKHYSICTESDGGKSLRDLSSGKNKLIQYL